MPKPKFKNTGTPNVEFKNRMPTKSPPNPKSTLCHKKTKTAKKKLTNAIKRIRIREPIK